LNTIGNKLRLTSYGESHGEAVGAVLDGFPSNFEPDLDFIRYQLERRRPGRTSLSSQRNEGDDFSVNAGLFEGKTTGSPLHFSIPNNDQNSTDYDHLKDVYRPSHADYTYEAKYGHRDHRGGGRSSARITAAWVAAGALAEDYLRKEGIEIVAYVRQIGTVQLQTVKGKWQKSDVDLSEVHCPDEETSTEMKALIEEAIATKDSLGGQITCIVRNVPAGLGDPVFGKLNARLASAMFSINAVKGFEIGGGFKMTSKKGSEVNDEFEVEGDHLKTTSNNSGGIQGGISNGMDITFNVAFKPTATIGKIQNTANRAGEEVKLEASGRHDPCVLPRAVPIVETMTALVILDTLL